MFAPGMTPDELLGSLPTGGTGSYALLIGKVV